MIDKKMVKIRKRLGELEREVEKLDHVVRELLYDRHNTEAVGKILTEQNKTLDTVIKCAVIESSACSDIYGEGDVDGQ